MKEEKKQTRKLNEHIESELFNKENRETPKVIKDGEQTPAKKKKPYYRKRYNKPKPVEEIIPEIVETKNYFIHGVIVGMVIGGIIFGMIEYLN